MPRAANFRKTDVIRAFNAAREAGVTNPAVEIVLKDGSVIRVIGGSVTSPGAPAGPGGDLDQWIKGHAV